MSLRVGSRELSQACYKIAANPFKSESIKDCVGKGLGTRIRVRLSETDAFGVVYYANYLVYFDVARLELLRRARVVELLSKEKLNFVAASATCNYLAPARFNDLLNLRVRVVGIGESSVTYGHEILRTKDSTKVATGRVIDVMVDSKGATTSIPGLIRSKMRRYAGLVGPRG